MQNNCCKINKYLNKDYQNKLLFIGVLKQIVAIPEIQKTKMLCNLKKDIIY